MLSIVSLLQSTWVLIIIVLTLIRFKYGIVTYMAYVILVPYMSISIGPFYFQWNFINLFLLLVFVYRFKSRHSNKIDWMPLIPFLLYFGVSLFMMLFQHDTPLEFELEMWRAMLMKVIILPLILWNQMNVDVTSKQLFRNTMLCCISIASIYGLYQTQIVGMNPYIAIMTEINGQEFNESYAAAGGGRIFGRLSSVFSNPQSFGLFLGLALFYLFSYIRKINRQLLLFLILIILIDIIVCGVRSVIAGVGIALVFYFIQNRNVKYLFITIIVSVLFYWGVEQIPNLSKYVSSVVNLKNEDVSGSSFEMRLGQLEGCLYEIRNCNLFGKGFSWVSYYMSNHGNHPTILAFESLIFIILCNSGYVGLGLWILFCFLIVKNNFYIAKGDSDTLNALLGFYISYSFITGEYGYMPMFLLFYVLMLGDISCVKSPKFSTETKKQEIV